LFNEAVSLWSRIWKRRHRVDV